MGRDKTDVSAVLHNDNFNSHARVGRDQIFRRFRVGSSISTHTPAWGVTADRAVLDDLRKISTHTPAWGVTNAWSYAKAAIEISTHTPAWGVTMKLWRFWKPSTFQLTRPRGA